MDFAREVEGLEQEIRDLRRKMIDVNDGDEGRFSRDEIQGTGRFIILCPMSVREATKKVFFIGPVTKALPPPPLELIGHLLWGDFFRASRKVFFFLEDRPVFAASLTMNLFS